MKLSIGLFAAHNFSKIVAAANLIDLKNTTLLFVIIQNLPFLKIEKL